MTTFEVTLKDRAVERVDAADAYQQEGPLTTFFRTDGQRGTVDSWSTRVASFRTAEIVIIRRHDDDASTPAERPAVPLAVPLPLRSA